MRLLLDTQVALWWLVGSKRLLHASRRRIASSHCVVSVASVWEVAIKFQLDRLPVAPGAFLGAARAGGFRLLPITPDHAAATVDLPRFHTDPFDRLLLAQARQEQLTLLTADAALAAYGPNVRHLQ